MRKVNRNRKRTALCKPLILTGTSCRCHCGTVNMSLPHLLCPVSRHICLTYHIPASCDCTVPAQWHSLLSDTTLMYCIV